MAQNKVKAVTRGFLDGTTLSGTYQAINSTPFQAACFRIAIYNTTNAAVDISFDGTTDNDVVPATSFIVIDAQTNSQPNANTALFMNGLVVYVKGASGAGDIYVSGYYVSP
jgi:hypothetical protein